MKIKCACGCGETLEYDGVRFASLYCRGHEKVIEEKQETESRNIRELLEEKNSWKFVSEECEKVPLTRAQKEEIRVQFRYTCVVCGKHQDDQIKEAVDKGKRAASLVIYQIGEKIVPICADCFKLTRKDKKGLHNAILNLNKPEVE